MIQSGPEHPSPNKDSATPSASEVRAPTINLPKGGGAIRGIGEKFAANPVTGTGTMSVPIATSPGRSGFGPQLSLSYDSGAGNGPFGFGWNLSLPSITRKTDKGLPQYFDAQNSDAQDSDVVILSGAEDLVPVYRQNATGAWVCDAHGNLVIHEEDIDGYRVRRYRPRIEGLFARIERWTRVSDPRDVHWRSISKDNILTLYGKDTESRIVDPEDASHIFSWLICETRDDKGNGVLYRYKAEDGLGVDLDRANERNRGPRNDSRRTANRYLKRIHYGNLVPLLDNAGQRPRTLTQAQIANAGWMFEAVFDYGEHDPDTPKPNDAGAWEYRTDPFSSYRSGFDVRTYRLCQRVLIFHHFDGEEGVGQDCLVRSTDFTYSHEQDPANTRNPVYTFLRAVTQTSYKRNNGSYLRRGLPPVEFEYTQSIVQDTVQEVDAASLENLPTGVDGAGYQWTDLHGEGIPGILTEQAGTWFYKRNVSPISKRPVEFAPLERVAVKPNFALAGGAQFMDLAGDGQPDLVVLDGPMPGLYKHDEAEGWQPFHFFTSRLNRDMRDPNLKFVDLDGDGHADVLITEDEAFVWHASMAEEGFGPARRVTQALDEEKGPRLVFADGTQSIYLADMSGDGLTDLVRIRNGDVCYWPNLGYGRFGAKVTMDHAPHFDNPDQFDQKCIRLADIDGSGTTDIIYLHRDGVRLYFNQSGNSWSASQPLRVFPRVDDLVSIVPADLFGNGTACLVWASSLPGDARRQMRYVDLMGGQKPHLLVKSLNNLGSETRVQYTPSTKFYLQDKRDGKPWITKLPFPVHVVETVTVTDQWRKTTFSSTYSYHHGYFDGIEREFRGFGRVEQVDTESYGKFASGNTASPYITDDKTLYQPPVKTVTWYHTGVALNRERIRSQFEHEYFPRWFEAMRPDEVNVLGTFQENVLPEPDLAAQDLSAEEWREALRACKGMMLRQEVVELEVDALERGEHRPVRLFSTAYHNCHIRRIQPQAGNRFAVFLVAENEAITYHYELDLTTEDVRPDPRIAHGVNLTFDEYANVLQSVAVVYSRLGQHVDSTLPSGTEALITTVQRERHVAYTETRYTNDSGDSDHHRLRVPCEVLTYELTGISPEDQNDLASADPPDNRYFAIDEWRAFRLSEVHQTSGTSVEAIDYHQLPIGTIPQKRIVEHVRSLYFNPNLQDAEPFGVLNHLGIAYETYKLALTEDLLGTVFGAKLTADIRARLDDASVSGYLSGANLTARFPGADTTGQFWIRSGIVSFAPDAAQHFYLPERYIDPFGSETTLEYDPRDLFIASSTDALGNQTRVTRFDFRVLAPQEMQDSNDNLSEVFFDVLGLPTAMAVKGKGNGTEGDHLTGFNDALANPDAAVLTAFFVDNAYDEAQARSWLGNATARHVYYFGETRNPDGSIVWGTQPACACGIVRERHVAQLESGEQSRIQASFEYSDGMGSVVVKKIQTEPAAPGQPKRWIASGKTILNNKGKPVKQYEPYFSPTGHRFEEPQEEGVTPVIYYDAAGRTIRTELPDGSYSRVEFSPWHVTAYDQNDTVLEPGNDWFSRHTAATASAENKRAAQLTAEHANTPTSTFLDSLGRDVISVAHNRWKDDQGTLHDEKAATCTKLDAEGKPLWIRDARGNLVMQYLTPPVPSNQATDPVTGFVPCYDIAGNLLFQHSMDAGERWMLNDAAGQPLVGWDSRGFMRRITYDALRRPTGLLVTENGTERLAERTVYGEAQGVANNHRARVYQVFDAAGVVTTVAYDFKGNPLQTTRELLPDYKSAVDWQQNPAANDGTFTSSNSYDALNRPVTVTAPDGSVYRPTFNEANLLDKVDVNLRGAATATPFVTNINYDAKGQRELIAYGNGARTTYDYDSQTFRLVHLQTVRGTDRLQDLFYTYDPVGNITHIQDDAQQTLYFNGQVVEPRNDYTYDALYRLIEGTGREHIGQTANDDPQLKPHYDSNDSTRRNLPHPNDGQAMRNYSERYEYDAVGNILKWMHAANGGSWTRDHVIAADSNRLLQTSLPGGNFASYDYDEHGSMDRMPHLPLMQWNFKDQLQATSQQVVNNGTPESTYYVYDASGQRVRKVTEGQATAGQTPTRRKERIYLGGFEVYREYGNDGATVTLERETLHVMDDKQRIALVETKNLDVASPLTPHPSLVRYQFGNHLGSASLELDDRGQILSYEEYTPYGSTAYQAVRSGVEASPKRYRYTGKERDEETGFTYHGTRYCAPWLGRWSAADPIGIGDGLNVYGYVGGNPITLNDHSGTKGERPKLMSQLRMWQKESRAWEKRSSEINNAYDLGSQRWKEGMAYIQPRIDESRKKLGTIQKQIDAIDIARTAEIFTERSIKENWFNLKLELRPAPQSQTESKAETPPSVSTPNQEDIEAGKSRAYKETIKPKLLESWRDTKMSMGGMGTLGEIELKRVEIARKALEHEGSSDWDSSRERGEIKAGADKCNLFLTEMFEAAGVTPPTTGGRLGRYSTSAAQWANPDFDVPEWRVLGPKEKPQPGDVAVRVNLLGDVDERAGHVGIVVDAGKTISVAHGKNVHISEWGFRPEEQKDPTVFRRYVGPGK
ncbi:MAG: SpvB/TcaC N-terminal domain-containing protein [Candidatus Nitrotoga sp.]